MTKQGKEAWFRGLHLGGSTLEAHLIQLRRLRTGSCFHFPVCAFSCDQLSSHGLAMTRRATFAEHACGKGHKGWMDETLMEEERQEGDEITARRPPFFSLFLLRTEPCFFASQPKIKAKVYTFEKKKRSGLHILQ